MYERILVGLDGSALAERVLPYIQALAERFGSRVILLQATLPPQVPIGTPGLAPDAVMPLDLGEIAAEERQAARTYLDELAQRLRAAGLAVETVQPEGDPAAVILDHARAPGADLIAMTTHGRGGLGRLFYG